ncbi:MAG: hypothetical protein H0W12_09885 [Chitinophagaceae bacterium]|nr:hypothetical protein [Chitinophagaceae bacterium]
MENESNIETLVDRVRNYVETQADLLRLKAIDKSSSFISSLFSVIVLGVLGLMILILINIGLSLLIGECLGKIYYGFFIMAGFYVLAGFVLFAFRDKWLKNPIVNMMVKTLLN